MSAALVLLAPNRPCPVDCACAVCEAPPAPVAAPWPVAPLALVVLAADASGRLQRVPWGGLLASAGLALCEWAELDEAYAECPHRMAGAWVEDREGRRWTRTAAHDGLVPLRCEDCGGTGWTWCDRTGRREACGCLVGMRCADVVEGSELAADADEDDGRFGGRF
jgi:hypothetical protein